MNAYHAECKQRITSLSTTKPHIVASTETITAEGHRHVAATHETTFELTTDDYLTPAGDCILGINADTAPIDFDPDFTTTAQSHETTITATLTVNDHSTTITGRGHPDLSFTNTRSLVFRTSTYIDDRTVMIDASAAANDIDRSLIAALTDGASLTCRLTATPSAP